MTSTEWARSAHAIQLESINRTPSKRPQLYRHDAVSVMNHLGKFSASTKHGAEGHGILRWYVAPSFLSHGSGPTKLQISDS